MFYKFRNLNCIIKKFTEYKYSNVKQDSVIKDKVIEFGYFSTYKSNKYIKNLILNNKDFCNLCAKIELSYTSNKFILASEEIKKDIYIKNIKLKILKIISILEENKINAILMVNPSNYNKRLSREENAFQSIITSTIYELYEIPYEYLDKFKKLDKFQFNISDIDTENFYNLLNYYIFHREQPLNIKYLVDEATKNINIIKDLNDFNKILE